MEIYNDRDLQLFKNRIPTIIKKINDIVLTKYDPTQKEIMEVQKHILKFIKEKKRKLYGGYGLHLIIKNKTHGTSFYKEEELYLKDLDIYTPKPIHDIIEISNILHGLSLIHI